MQIDAGIFERVCSIFDHEWYLNSVRLGCKDETLTHFLTVGLEQGLSPTPFFDAAWYCESNPAVAASGMVPLIHYIVQGEAEGRWPCRLLDSAWYARANGLQPGHGVVLEHYTKFGSKQGLKPNAVFDPHFYVGQHADLPRDVRIGAVHYLRTGFREAREVAEDFSARSYRQQHALFDESVDVVHHFLTGGEKSGHTKSSGEFIDAASEVRRFVLGGPEFEEFDPEILKSGDSRAKVIAFYLPQFHAIPENDEWWGAGFTEWRNVARGSPRFVGHYQPRIPRDLGFYDLLTPGVMRRQIELAKAAGIHGFCFYYYLFGQRKILEQPIERLLADPSLDMPFCLMWANENWTRRWDGQDAEILLEQHYEEADDDYLIEDVARFMNDPRYLRIDGRPLFTVYRPELIPNMRERVARWREKFFKLFGQQPWLLMAQSFHDHDPTVYGLDGAVEFPPHKVLDNLPSASLNLLDHDFTGRVFEYRDVVDASLGFSAPAFPLIKTAFPGWDNDARRQGAGTSITNSSPVAYQRWLTGLIDYSKKHPFAGENIVFINAWNEWAEGAYLEPDVHFGSAYLNATSRALVGESTRTSKFEVVLVGHDAYKHGAQMTLLGLGRIFARRFGVKVVFLLLQDGPLVPAYEELGRVIICDAAGLGASVAKLQAEGVNLAITNTVVTGVAVGHLKRSGFRVVSLIHELPRLIREFNIEGAAHSIAAASDIVVFPAPLVRDAFTSAIGSVSGQSILLPQGLYAEIAPDLDSRVAVRQELDLPVSARLVVGIGYADLRKGIDLFLETARLARNTNPNLVFLWIGRLERSVSAWLVDEADASGNVRFVDFTSDIGRYLSAADVFYMASREDPFPSTVLEALACGLPIVGFAGRTGSEQLIARFGAVVPAYDTAKVLDAVGHLIATNSEERTRARQAAVASEFRWDEYAFKLLQYLDPALKRVSVVVPNYNYAHYLQGRLDSIFSQYYPVFEIVVLDDASNDDSVEVLNNIASMTGRDFTVVKNAKNSGSIMKQWSKAAAITSGDCLWIAEADDLAMSDFLQELVGRMSKGTVFAFSDSSQIDASGAQLSSSYDYYFNRFHRNAFKRNFSRPAPDFAKQYLATSNMVLNVSSVVFQRSALDDLLRSEIDELSSYRFAGDWVAYLGLCTTDGQVRFVARPLNIHRRHSNSATHTATQTDHVGEIKRVHGVFIRLFGEDEVVRQRQKSYRAEVRRDFGLPEEPLLVN